MSEYRRIEVCFEIDMPVDIADEDILEWLNYELGCGDIEDPLIDKSLSVRNDSVKIKEV